MNTITEMLTAPFVIIESVCDAYADCIPQVAVVSVPAILACGFLAGWFL